MNEIITLVLEALHIVAMIGGAVGSLVIGVIAFYRGMCP